MHSLDRNLRTVANGNLRSDWRRLTLWACGAVVAIAGCAGWPKGPGAIADVHQERLKRATEAAAAFEVKRSDAEYQAALSHWRQENFDACRKQLDTLLERNPEHRPAILLRIELALHEDRPGDVVERLADLLKTRQDDAELSHAMGMVREALGEMDEAQDRFRQAARLDPENELYALSCGGDQEQTVADDAAQVSWQEDEAAVDATAVNEVADEEAGGAALPERVSSKDADDPLDRAIQALKQSQPAQAVQIIERALEDQPPTGGLYRTLGAAHYRLGDYESAQEALMESLSLDNTHPLSYFLMGCTLSKLGQKEAAERHFQRAQRLDGRYDRPE